MSKYTAEQVEVLSERDWLAKDVRKALRDYATLLREREDYEGTACDICGEPNLHGSRHRQCGLALQTAVAKELGERESASARVPDGFALVPIEPTEAMVRVNTRMLHPRIAAEIYKAMLAAAPKRGEG